MTEYRRKNSSDAWHWCKNCSNYPKSGYTTYNGTGRPSSNELCDECRGKEKNNDCTK